MNYKNLFQKLEANLDKIERSENALETLSTIIERLVEDFRSELGILGGRVYVRKGEFFEMQKQHPAGDMKVGYRIPLSYPPVQALLRQGYVVYDMDNPQADQELESTIDGRVFAAICVGQLRQRIISFSLKDSSDWQHVIYSLNTIRHVVNLKLRKEHLEDRLAEARTIQLSLLPSSTPRFADYDIWGSTLPAEEVGGDLYDFIQVSERSMGIAIADSAGHGLPAALQARDAIIGLRMSVEERWRITATIEKLNKVVGHSALVSRFISLFYCEVEPNGTMVYCNAGHNPPLLYQQGAFRELSRGGLILGPNPHACYERGYEQMDPGTLLLAYTDGITEAQDGDGEMYGTERLKTLIEARATDDSRHLVEAIFDDVRSFSGLSTPTDDQTVVAVRRGSVPVQ